MANKDTQTEVTNNTICNHEEEINQHVKELDVLCQLKYNKETVGSFIENITKDYEQRIKENKKLRDEIERIRLRLQEAEKYLRRN